MKENQPPVPPTPEKTEPAFTPLGTLPSAPLRPRDGDIIHTSPELTVGEGDDRSAELSEVVAGTSLSQDAWRRLRKNKLAIFGMIVLGTITLASLIGPYLIKQITGLT